MLRDVLGALHATGVAGIALLTPDDGFAAVAESSARTLTDDPARRIANLQTAAVRLAADGATRWLSCPPTCRA
jgi:2-phospho-L-lactate guanylyltransferase (CobY/MobA/RfbA family)